MDKKNLYEMSEASCMNVNDDEVEKIINNINPLLDYMKTSKRYEDSKHYVSKTISYDELSEDNVKESLTLDEVFLNTDSRKYAYFKVKEFVE